MHGWKRGGVVILNFSQTSLTNWAAGGENSVAANGLFSAFANYKKGKSVWVNSLDIGYGILSQGKENRITKSDDKIDLLSKYGRKAFGGWYYAALLNFKTQMAKGYNYPNDSTRISGYLAPAYILGALGADYKPGKYFSSFISPISSKITIVNDQFLANKGAFGVDPAVFDTSGILTSKGRKSICGVGGYVRIIYSRADFSCEFLRNVSFTSKIDLFSNYIEKPGNIDINWETLIAFKINKYISVNITTHLIYDNDIDIAIDTNGDDIADKYGPRIQFKEILGAGFSYKF